MIDTNKYEGHTRGERFEFFPSGWCVDWVEPCTWHIRDPDVHLVGSEANRLLIQDAPLLLAEVKRLYEMMDVLASFNIVKNVEQGFTQREWVELVELAKRGEEE